MRESQVSYIKPLLFPRLTHCSNVSVSRSFTHPPAHFIRWLVLDRIGYIAFICLGSFCPIYSVDLGVIIGTEREGVFRYLAFRTEIKLLSVLYLDLHSCIYFPPALSRPHFMIATRRIHDSDAVQVALVHILSNIRSHLCHPCHLPTIGT